MVPFRRALSQNYVSLAEGRIERAKTDGDLAAELWLALRQLAEVEEVGIGLLHSHNAERRSRAADVLAGEWREFRAYIRQAENFYQGASVLHWTSSPLNYYYAFLNLAKAGCLLADTFKPRTTLGGGNVAATPRHVNHGLSEKTLIGSPTRWTVTVRAPTDVFSLYYQLSLDHCVIPTTVLEIHDLLGYAAMVSRMTFVQAVRAYQTFLQKSGSGIDARESILGWLSDCPRLADVAVWVAASESTLGMAAGTFVKALNHNQRNSVADNLEGDLLLETIQRLSLPWQGTCKELLNQMEDIEQKPRTAKALSNLLRMKGPALRQMGITSESKRSNGRRLLTLHRPASVSQFPAKQDTHQRFGT